MPRAIPSIPNPTATTPGIQLQFVVQGPGIVDIALYYPPDPDGPFRLENIWPLLSAAQRAALVDIMTVMLGRFRDERGYV
jgi:hypothetical protein